MKTVVIGMSGGVDSSVSAYLLKKAGYRVIALFMKNWEDSECPAKEDFDDVVRVAKHLDIPYYSVNFTEEYKKSVFDEFLDGLKKGLTPNPDILCNREIKFKTFLEKARLIQAPLIATGHYCRLDANNNLLRGIDPHKDQSYFLHFVEKEALKNVLFPIGHLRKSEVRKIAKRANLPTANKKDSTGICFIGKRDFKPFISSYIQPKKGPFKTLEGTVVGEHDGASLYTIGQRKGLSLGGAGKAWFVVDKDIETNTVFVERGEDHPALFSKSLKAEKIHWIAESPKRFPFRCTAKVRYRQKDTPCILFEDGSVLFEEKQRAITLGQSVVFYRKEICLGGGIITSTKTTPCP